MKLNRLFLAAALTLGLAMGCSKEQSELSLDSIGTTATVSGVIRYNKGYVESTTHIYPEYMAPAASIQIYVDLDLDNYVGDATGVKRYTTTTDENGNYSFTLPVSINKGAISGDIEIHPFTKSYFYYYEDEDDGKVTIYEDKVAYYSSFPTSTFSLSAGDNAILNIEIETAPEYFDVVEGDQDGEEKDVKIEY